jgi:SAM-dependent methyltransferase
MSEGYKENPVKIYPGIEWAISRWTKHKFVIPPDQRKIYEVIADIYQGKSFVDVGSSFGVGANILSHRAMGVWAVDKEEELVEFGKALFGSPRLKFDVYDILTPPNRPTSTFDVVLMLEVIEHLPRDQWDNALINLKRFFREGTVGFISTPNRNSPNIGQEHPNNEFHTYEAIAGEFYGLMISHFNSVTMYSVPKLNILAQEETVDGLTTDTPLLVKVEGVINA